MKVNIIKLKYFDILVGDHFLWNALNLNLLSS